MESFVQELGTQKILSKEDIVLLKKYINKKYINSSDIEKSNILTKTVHQILDKNFQGLKTEYIKIIKSDLLKNILIKDVQSILLVDIFNACILAKDKSQDFFEDLLDWINLHVENKISKADLEEYCIKYTSITEYSNTTLNELYIESEFDITPLIDNVEYTSIEELPASDNYIDNSSSDLANTSKIKTLVSSFCSTKAFKFSSCFFLIFFILFFLNKYNFFDTIIHSSIHNGTAQIIVDAKTSANKHEDKANVTVSRKFPENLPKYFMYKDINETQLKKYLDGRDSLLCDEPYFSTIISVSKEYNLNPLVIFAITGQEQSFVPKNNSDSKTIANNPYNIFHSWKEYNTNIDDATRIVCNTIINLSKDMPENEEPFFWINKQYAEDKKWSKGVKQIYETLEKNDSNKDTASNGR